MKSEETVLNREEKQLAQALAAFDQGARVLEDAYRELWSARETERADRSLAASESIRDLCHEIKNPLGGVRGMSSLLQRELARHPRGERADRLLAKIIEGLDAIEGVLRDFSADAGERADAGAIAEETAGLALAENQAGGGNVRFRVDAPEGVELPLSGARFRKILTNLVRNATEACGDEGEVVIRVASGFDDVIVSVQDDGRGLPPVLDRELFRRGFSTKGRSRGRGLALVDELVRQAGGTLMFGRLERGTLARVRLPRS